MFVYFSPGVGDVTLRDIFTLLMLHNYYYDCILITVCGIYSAIIVVLFVLIMKLRHCNAYDYILLKHKLDW